MNLLEKIFTENGVIAGLFILVLFGFYKLAKWFLGKYLVLLEDKDKAIIKSFGDIVIEVQNGGKTSINEHIETRELIKEKHNEIIKLIK